jgi:hypothetical protein
MSHTLPKLRWKSAVAFYFSMLSPSWIVYETELLETYQENPRRLELTAPAVSRSSNSHRIIAMDMVATAVKCGEIRDLYQPSLIRTLCPLPSAN